MLIIENIRLALSSLRVNKMRTILTMLGIVIGIASVIAIMVVGDSVKNNMLNSYGNMGANNITLYVTQLDYTRQIEMTDRDYINQDMIDKLKLKFPKQIADFSLSRDGGQGNIKIRKTNATVSIQGISIGYQKANKIQMVAGTEITDREMNSARKTALVSDKLVAKLFQGDNQRALGQKIDVKVDNKYYSYTIIGVYKYNMADYGGPSGASGDSQTNLYIPLTTQIKQTGEKSQYNFLTIMAADGTDAQQLTNQITQYLNTTFYRDNKQFMIQSYSMESMINEMDKSISTIRLAIAGIGAISLLVGGIGVMNIMIVSITERTREIGTRKALGATNNSIRLQFIVESVVICLIGGFIGVILGIGLGLFISKMIGYSGAASPLAMIGSVLFSMVLGVFFGFYPANRAAKLNPIDALRYE